MDEQSEPLPVEKRRTRSSKGSPATAADAAVQVTAANQAEAASLLQHPDLSLDLYDHVTSLNGRTI